MKLKCLSLWIVFAGFVVSAEAQDTKWKPAPGPLKTRWAAQVSPNNALPHYPRPLMVRSRWMNLNGLWDYAISDRGATSMPENASDKILVPYPIESSLSGVAKRVSEKETLWYRRTFRLPQSWHSGRVMLHFGAVDWESTVYVNGQNLGTHRGGYDGFSYDITAALKKSGPQELVVSVWDPTDSSTQPRGKQIRKPESIWYTPTTGIWQTVWLEPLPKTSISSLHIVTDIDRNRVQITADLVGDTRGLKLKAEFGSPGIATRTVSGSATQVTLSVPKARLWSPEFPTLYDLRIKLLRGKQTVDTVQSYFGMRKISLGKDSQGRTRLCLNNRPYFQLGPLDQGFWPDGLYTAPTDDALRYDIEITKRLGFNMARKHVKVEPERWYYWCDRLGLLVWQDMPSGDRYIGPNQPDINRTAESEEIYRTEWKEIISERINHPSIVMWVPFNEGWGQFKTDEIATWTKSLDPSRLVNSVSGWADRKTGDVHDWHVYPGPGTPDPEAKRAAVLGEYGGLGLPMEGHTWQAKDNWGYRSFTTREALTDAYVDLQKNLLPLIGTPGCSAAVYTQTTDVEIEVNGLMTYDREITKMEPHRVRNANLALYGQPPRLVTVLSTSESEKQAWRYTTSRPSDDWMSVTFADSSWTEGSGGFGTAGTPGIHLGTDWSTRDIWLRRSFRLSSAPNGELFLRIHHDEDAEIYLNGVLAARVRGYTTGYTLSSVSKEAKAALKSGDNTIAVHCHQTGGGQYIDVGLQEAVLVKR